MAARPSMGKTIFLVLAMLFLGSHNTINTKLQFQTCAPSTDPIAQTKPDDGCPVGQMKYKSAWLNNLVMFLGESTMMLAYGISRRRALAGAREATLAAEATAARGLVAQPAQPAASNWVFAIPAFCDVFGTGLATVGMLYMEAAIWQMLRSAIIVFSAILSVLFLKRRLQPFHWVAVGVVLVALFLVGWASMLDDSKTTSASSSERILGIALVVGAQCVSAFQMVFEEKLVSGTSTSAKKVVGMEGIFGTIYMVILLTVFTMVPGNDKGSYENWPNGLHEMFNKAPLLLLNILFMLSIAGYNFVGLTIAKHMSSVVRCLVDSCRTIVVWGVNLFIYYYISKDYGAAWLAHSWLTALGFVVLVVGTLLYNEVLPAPACLKHPEVQDGELPRVQSGLDEVLTKSRIGVDDEEEFQASTAHNGSVQCAESRA